MTRKKRIKAYKRHFSFALTDQDKYLLFLKRHFQQTKPRFYSVVAKKYVQGMDCKIWVLTLDNNIEDPNYEIIAECVINNEKIYLWRDCCWGIAVNGYGIPIIVGLSITLVTSYAHTTVFNDETTSRHTVALFKIGNQTVE